MIGVTVLPTTFLSDVLGREEHRLDDHDPILATDQIAPQLSPREKLVLHCLVKGDSNKSIAKKLDSAEATVKVHVQAILRRIRVHNRTQAAIWAMKNASHLRTSVDTAPPLSDKVHPDVDTRRLDDHEPVLATDKIAPVATNQIAPQLSPREKLVLRCLVEGDSNKSIAKKLDSAEATIKAHVKTIRRKLRVHSRTQASDLGDEERISREATVRKAPEN